MTFAEDRWEAAGRPFTEYRLWGGLVKVVEPDVAERSILMHLAAKGLEVHEDGVVLLPPRPGDDGWRWQANVRPFGVDGPTTPASQFGLDLFRIRAQIGERFIRDG